MRDRTEERLHGEEADRRRDTLQVTDPARVYLQSREQRDILREIDELEHAGDEVKEPTLADQLAEARARRVAGT